MSQTRHILVVGTHPIGTSIIKQFNIADCNIEICTNFGEVESAKSFDELFVLPLESTADHDILKALETFAVNYPDIPEGLLKPICHLLLHDKMTLWLMQTLDIYVNISQKFELYAFTMEDQWAKNVLCGLGEKNAPYLPLDREKIDAVSNKVVHLVIAGFSDLAESLAIHAALVAHYPNNIFNPSLRTRITIVDEQIAIRRNAFIQRYISLFDNSYHRTVELNSRKITQYHEPIYHATREDFVDVEWEFVEGNFHDPLLQHKLKLWGEDKEQLLTLALCNKDSTVNFDRAFALPTNIYRNGIPVLIYVKQADMLNKVHETDSYRNLYPFGMDDCGYDVNLPLLQMAKRLNYFYACSFDRRDTPTNMPVDDIEKEWRKLNSFSIRYSNIYNVMTLPTKMRSLGHKAEEWDKFYALTQEEIELISAVEHNRWSVERMVLGFRPPTDTERDEIKDNIEAFITAKKTGGEPPAQDLKTVYKKQKVHYDLCSYRELREDKTGQNVRIYDYDLTASIPLIAQSFNEMRP